MITYQALPTQTPKITKRYCRNLALAVSVVVVLTVILTSCIFANVTQASGSSSSITNPVPGFHTENVMSGSIVLNPGGYFFKGFYVPDNAKNPVLQGNYTVINNSTNSAASVTIWSQQEFVNYLNNHNASPCYNRDMFPMPSDNVNVTLATGPYFIMVGSATGNTNILQAQINLTYNIS
jgi:hypothetical protein